ncbi:MAG: hypothetical protein K2N51_07950 [Lachnospiraceae bacterium]|nr:hypothetical protein [Lachnospiraceae bacterium]
MDKILTIQQCGWDILQKKFVWNYWKACQFILEHIHVQSVAIKGKY